MAKEKSQKRFIKTHSDGAFSSNEIWVDSETGVNYLFSLIRLRRRTYSTARP